MRPIVELIAARVSGTDLRYAMSRRRCPERADPDAAARAELAHLFPSMWLRGVMLHSTSWRYADGDLILTYLGYSDDLPLALLPLVLPEGAPTNDGDTTRSVAAHAVRHLAFLIRQNGNGFAARLRPEGLAYLRNIDPEVAGRIYLKDGPSARDGADAPRTPAGRPS